MAVMRNALVWRWFENKSPMVKDSRVAHAIRNICSHAFTETTPWPTDSIRWRLEMSTMLGLLTYRPDVPLEGVVGYSILTIPSDLLMTGHLLWEDSIAIVQAAQGYGHSNLEHSIAAAAQLLNIHDIRWIGGCTQNPLMGERYAHRGIMYPLHESYEGETGRCILKYLCEHVPQVRERLARIDRRGVCRGVYKKALYRTSHAEVGSSDAFDNMPGYNANDGDALICCTEVVYLKQFSANIRVPFECLYLSIWDDTDRQASRVIDLSYRIPDYQLRVAYCGDEAVGYLSGMAVIDGSIPENLFVVDELGVSPRWRGRGYGRYLLDCCATAAERATGDAVVVVPDYCGLVTSIARRTGYSVAVGRLTNVTLPWIPTHNDSEVSFVRWNNGGQSRVSWTRRTSVQNNQSRL